MAKTGPTVGSGQEGGIARLAQQAVGPEDVVQIRRDIGARYCDDDFGSGVETAGSQCLENYLGRHHNHPAEYIESQAGIADREQEKLGFRGQA